MIISERSFRAWANSDLGRNCESILDIVVRTESAEAAQTECDPQAISSRLSQPRLEFIPILPVLVMAGQA